MKVALARALWLLGNQEERKALEYASILPPNNRDKERNNLGRFNAARRNRQWRRR